MSKTKNQKERRLITAALPYINNVPHLGHIAGSHLPADIFARYCRARGYETLFIGGTDENGSTSEIVADEIGIPIEVFSEKLYREHKKVYDWFNISYDSFSRTSKEIHHKTTQEFFKKIYDNGFITEDEMSVFYSPEEERFLPDRYVKGTCAKCGYTEANGDQCEKCTAILDTSSLLNPVSATSGKPVEVRKVKHLFFKLSEFSEKLEKWIKSQTHWREQVRNLALGWIKEGLKDRCITRDLKHGVKVPLKEFEDKVFYVWFDAPIGYISSTKEASENWENFWKEKNTRIYHFLGKDNIPFHTIFWPAMLMANGEFILPYHIEGLQYLNYEGKKFSKSKKIGVFCEKLPGSSIDPDVLRGYLSFIIPDTGDSDFKWRDFQYRINSEIIGNFGNFINRTLSFIYNKLDGEILKPSVSELSEDDKNLIEKIKEKVVKIEESFEKVHLKTAFLEILSLCAEGNKYFNDREPWVIVKKNALEAKKILYICATLCRVLAVLIQPFLPAASEKIWKQLNLKGSPSEKGIWGSLILEDLNGSEYYGSILSQLPEKHKISKPSVLFQKLKDEDISKLKKHLSDVRELREFFNC